MKRIAVGVLTVLVAGAGMVLTSPPTSAAPGGPVVLMGIDAEDGGIGGHGPISVYTNVVKSVLSNATNGGTGLLVIGGGKSAGDDVTTFWNAIGSGVPVPITFVNGAAIATKSFAGFKALAVVSSQNETPSGGLTQGENNALTGRKSDVANFVNSGGGLIGTSQTGLTNPYAYIAALGAFTQNTGLSYTNITPTPDGAAIGITNALDVCCWHDEYLTFPSFLKVLATNAATGKAAALGGVGVLINPNADLSITKAESADPVLSPDTLTYTLTVKNTGSDASNVVVTDDLPAGVTFVGFGNTSGFACTYNGAATPEVKCTKSSLVGGATATIVIVVRPTGAARTLTNTAKVTSATPDVDANDQTATITTQFIPCSVRGSGNITGTAAHEIICGSPGPDRINGMAGNDIIYGFGGDDWIDGFSGDELIYGGLGNDTIKDTSGHDRIFGEAGNDIIDGGTGDDYLDGGTGTDNLTGNGGFNDRCVNGESGFAGCEAFA